jgi:hypothetical protein
VVKATFWLTNSNTRPTDYFGPKQLNVYSHEVLNSRARVGNILVLGLGFLLSRAEIIPGRNKHETLSATADEIKLPRPSVRLNDAKLAPATVWLRAITALTFAI